MTSRFPIIDIHAHLLPGLDDGPRTLDQALRMCELYVADGVATVVATPHMLDHRFEASPAAVRRGVQRLSQACQARAMPLEILPGADIHLTPELLGALDAGEALTVADGHRYLLLELPAQVVPPIHALVRDLSRRGLTPVLTHPERHLMLWRRPGALADLVAAGCLVQVTADAVVGHLGAGPRRAARCFLDAGLVHVVASDAHSPRERRPQLRRAADHLAAVLGEASARELLQVNPTKIIRGQPLPGTATGGDAATRPARPCRAAPAPLAASHAR